MMTGSASSYRIPGQTDADELTLASERETFKRAALNWLDQCLEYAPRSQLRDISTAMNNWEPGHVERLG